jgi:superfamily II RNA helicase
MVKVCPKDYPQESEEKYADYFDRFGFPLSSFQKYAIEAIVEGNHVLVTAHTGSGKTLPAEFAIQHFTGLGKKVIYTSPIKALSNQKYYEFTKKYPEISFGLLTGDIKTNPNADVLIMTTEILMNYLFQEGEPMVEGGPMVPPYPLLSGDDKHNDKESSCKEGVRGNHGFPLSPLFKIDIQNELGCVIFDEVHYINDRDRGQVWEKTILMLPPHIQMVMLSATIDNPEGFAEWCQRGSTEKDVYLASTNHRVVPLSHYGFLTTTEAIFKSVRDKETQKMIRDATNCLIPLQDHKGGFSEAGYRSITKITDLFNMNRVDMNRKHVLNQLSLFLRDRDMLPAIAFVFSRKNVELFAKDITIPLLEDDSKVGYTVRRECEQIVRKLPNYQEYLQLPEYNQLVSLLEKGIGIHHSGMIPVLREIVEIMISKKYIKLLFATESFAIGLDCPIRTAVFTSLTKFDGNGERYLMAHEYTQMAGRAGRRGIDTVGHVVHCNNLFKVPSITEYKTMLGGVPQKLVSKFHISYSLILNLLKNGQTNDFHVFSEKSMVQREIMNSISNQLSSISDLSDRIKQKKDSIAMARTPSEVLEDYLQYEDKFNNSVNKKKKEAERSIQAIKDKYRFVLDDIKHYKEMHAMETDLNDQIRNLNYTKNYIFDQTRTICNLLIDDYFIEYNVVTNEYSLLSLGKIASNIAEVHPLVMSKLMMSNAYFSNYSIKQLVGLFSCFTDVKIPSDMRSSIPNTDDTDLKTLIYNAKDIFGEYASMESEHDIRSGINYDDSLIYDMIEYSMKWCDCETEEECKQFIQGVISEKSISIGDFTKAMLKIVTISKELINVCESIGAIDLLFKLNQIESMILKYVLTSQSLYV